MVNLSQWIGRLCWARLLGLGLALVCLSLMALPESAVGQGTAPLARINAPSKGQEVRGAVSILGTAQANDMVRYEMAFAPEPDLTNWTVFGGATTAVNNGALGSWNTRPVPDGAYALRLQVFSSNGAVIETVVRELKLTNGNTSQAASTPGAVSVAPDGAADQVAATPTVTSGRTLSLSDIPNAIARGVRYTVYAFVGLGLYLLLKAGLNLLRKRVNQAPIDYGS